MKMDDLKFYWNGIKDGGGKLQGCTYSDSPLINHQPGTITIYGKHYKDFSPGVRAAFKVHDDSEIQSDYIVNEHIRVEPEHPLYDTVRAAKIAADNHYAMTSAKRICHDHDL